MSKLIQRPDLACLSELYQADLPDGVLLTEYPSSNSTETRFRNDRQFIIHDPFPPPPSDLLKSLGPHHLMCAWGQQLPVMSDVPPPSELIEHWSNVFAAELLPRWQPTDAIGDPSINTDPAGCPTLLTLFPHQSIAPGQQSIEPESYYHLHSKEAVGEIDCPQAEIFSQPKFPCIAKLSHGYAGLGNFVLRDLRDHQQMQHQLDQHWPGAVVVYNAIIPDIVGDFGVQFYLHRDGTAVWLGVTRQQFNENARWCGGQYVSDLQTDMIQPMRPFVLPTADYLHRHGYFGVVGIDVLQTASGDCFLVDLNPRLTGISPFLMASRFFQRQHDHTEGVYRASCRFAGTLEQLIETAKQYRDVTVLVLSGVQRKMETGWETVCHVSASATSVTASNQVLDEILIQS